MDYLGFLFRQFPDEIDEYNLPSAERGKAFHFHQEKRKENILKIM